MECGKKGLAGNGLQGLSRNTHNSMGSLQGGHFWVLVGCEPPNLCRACHLSSYRGQSDTFLAGVAFVGHLIREVILPSSPSQAGFWDFKLLAT